MNVNTAKPESVAPYLAKSFIPKPGSHKGQNGKVMVVGGSSLFHAAPIWSADVASYFADMVHFSSVEENNEILKEIKKNWQNGIVVAQKDIYEYIKEDDAVLLGTGMMRSGNLEVKGAEPASWDEVLRVEEEGERTYWITKFLLRSFPKKRWVIDAGALQMMDRQWLKSLETRPIVTPHQKEFKMLFGQDILDLGREEKTAIVTRTAREYGCVILLKAAYDIVSDGERTVVVEGGNAGLTKGGTGDILAGLTASFYTKMAPVDAAVSASFVLKKTAEDLSRTKGFWFNNTDLITHLADTLFSLYSSIPGLTDPL